MSFPNGSTVGLILIEFYFVSSCPYLANIMPVRLIVTQYQSLNNQKYFFFILYRVISLKIIVRFQFSVILTHCLTTFTAINRFKSYFVSRQLGSLMNCKERRWEMFCVTLGGRILSLSNFVSIASMISTLMCLLYRKWTFSLVLRYF